MANHMIARAPFGSTGHESSRVIFGAAALFSGHEGRAWKIFETLSTFGINHIDVAASYGQAEVCLAPILATHRSRYFLATKTGERGGDAARASLERSLERMKVDHVDMVQLHHLVDEEGWQTAFGPGGAVDALHKAKEEGLTRFIGVTGHGTGVARMHLQSLQHYPFDSVLLPYNYTMMSQPGYAAEFAALLELCARRGVAVQTIKAIARRRWREAPERRFSWYEPLRDEDAIARAVSYVLDRGQVFLNTSSDATLLRCTLEAADRHTPTANAAHAEAALRADLTGHGIEALFVPGMDEVG